ncbi:MAG: hypothetical protein GY832_18805 [Chloroflexi bacterium]|nr:hypothetical protein [Chloroflexota bacterium]
MKDLKEYPPELWEFLTYLETNGDISVDEPFAFCAQIAEAEEWVVSTWTMHNPAGTKSYRLQDSGRSVLAAWRAMGGQSKEKQLGRPTDDKKPCDVKIIAALAKHHDYQPGGKANAASVLNHEPADLKKLAEIADTTPKTVSKFLKEKFDGKTKKAGYDAACCREEIGYHLVKWQGDFSDQALNHIVEREIEARQREEE